jgi:hypothetical protein
MLFADEAQALPSVRKGAGAISGWRLAGLNLYGAALHEVTPTDAET